MRGAHDAAVAEISHQLGSAIPAVAGYLVGSMARGSDIYTGDYDVIVVMKTPLVPVYLRKLKRAAARLSNTLGLKVEVNPLPTFRLERAKDNLFLRKVKGEAKLLFGKDVLRDSKIGEDATVSMDWYLSYLTFLLKDTMNAYGTNDPVVVVSLTRKIATSLEWLSARTQGELSQSLGRYAKDLSGLTSSDRLTWFTIRDRLIDLFRESLMRFTDGNPTDLRALAEVLMKDAKGKSVLKNFEYAILLLLLRGEIAHPKWIFSRILVQDRYRAGLVLLSACASERGIDANLTSEACSVLNGCVKVGRRSSPQELWSSLGRAVLDRWSCADPAMGL